MGVARTWELPIAQDWTNRLRAGERAIRDRLARPVPARGSRIVGAAPSRVGVPTADTPAPAVRIGDVAAADLGSRGSTDDRLSAPPRETVTESAHVPIEAAQTDVPLPEPSVFAELSAAHRTLVVTAPRDRTFLYALGIVLLLHVGALIGTLRFDASEAARREREGQVEHPDSIAVELVEAPDAKSIEKRAQIGKVQPPAPPPTLQPPLPPPQPEQVEQKPQPPVKSDRAVEVPKDKPPEKPLEKQAEKPPVAAEPVKPDEGPDPLKQPEPIKDAALEPPPPPQEQRDKVDPQQAVPPPPPEATEFRGAAPEGKERAYAKGVREILARTKPQIWVRKAEVIVGFLLSATGELKLVKIIESSRDPVFDDVILEWIKRAKFNRPPPDAKPDDLQHIIHFTVQ